MNNNTDLIISEIKKAIGPLLKNKLDMQKVLIELRNHMQFTVAEEYGGDISATAKHLQIRRTTLCEHIKHKGLRQEWDQIRIRAILSRSRP